MEKDFRIGLIAGLIFMIGALIWVATRPSLSPEARVRGSGTQSPRPAATPTPEAGAAPPEESASSQGSLPPGVIPAEPEQTPPVSAVASIPPATPTPVPEPEQVNQPDLPDLTIYEQDEKIQTTKFHIVRRNESLSSISKQYYGTANRWQKILDANRETIRDPNRIVPGTKLIIPD